MKRIAKAAALGAATLCVAASCACPKRPRTDPQIEPLLHRMTALTERVERLTDALAAEPRAPVAARVPFAARAPGAPTERRAQTVPAARVSEVHEFAAELEAAAAVLDDLERRIVLERRIADDARDDVLELSGNVQKAGKTRRRAAARRQR
ncbi:MAG: hypothetical protein AAF628_11925 [Planctomycetota bacterium]